MITDVFILQFLKINKNQIANFIINFCFSFFIILFKPNNQSQKKEMKENNDNYPKVISVSSICINYDEDKDCTFVVKDVIISDWAKELFSTDKPEENVHQNIFKVVKKIKEDSEQLWIMRTTISPNYCCMRTETEKMVFEIIFDVRTLRLLIFRVFDFHEFCQRISHKNYKKKIVNFEVSYNQLKNNYIVFTY